MLSTRDRCEVAYRVAARRRKQPNPVGDGSHSGYRYAPRCELLEVPKLSTPPSRIETTITVPQIKHTQAQLTSPQRCFPGGKHALGHKPKQMVTGSKAKQPCYNMNKQMLGFALNTINQGPL